MQLSYKCLSDNFSLSKVFSSLGEFADVYKGILKSHEGKGVVAVKVLRVSPVMHCLDKMDIVQRSLNHSVRLTLLIFC